MVKKHLVGYIFLVILFSSTLYCGDIFQYRKKIKGNYYLVEGESKRDITICFKTDYGDYIGRIPSRILEYGTYDSFLVAKTEDYNNRESYYIINMGKDFDIAREKTFRIGPMSENEYNQQWQHKLKCKPPR
jgi:hypothetical protein